MKLCMHDSARLQYGHGTVDKGGIGDENLEERRVGGMKPIKVNAFDKDDGSDELGTG